MHSVSIIPCLCFSAVSPWHSRDPTLSRQATAYALSWKLRSTRQPRLPCEAKSVSMSASRSALMQWMETIRYSHSHTQHAIPCSSSCIRCPVQQCDVNLFRAKTAGEYKVHKSPIPGRNDSQGEQERVPYNHHYCTEHLTLRNYRTITGFLMTQVSLVLGSSTFHFPRPR